MALPYRIQPEDEYNARLQARVHPDDWLNPEPAGRYHLVVIGAGTAGLVTAAGAAGVGARVALVERALMGGDCLNYGCVPSKCVIRSSRVIGDMADGPSLGVHPSGEPQVDFGAVMERMRSIRARISSHDSAARFRDELGIDVFLGDAAFTGRDSVEVGGQTLRFKRAVIATGARAMVPPIEGLEDAGYYTNESIFSLTERPARFAVIGGGPIGCELAQAFARLGSRVTLVEMDAQFLPREDPDAAETLLASMREDGVDVRLSTRLVRVERHGAERVLHLETEDGTEEVVTDTMLVAVGRRPNVENLGLERAGVETDPRRGVVVDDRLRTSNKRIFACGDVSMEAKFTHAADAAARIVIQNALFVGRGKLSALTIPWCTYTDPEIAHVGVGQREAEERGLDVDVYTRNFDDVDRALADGEETGFVKVITAKGGDKILGCTIVARHAGEMIGEATLAIGAGIGLGRLARVIHPYPTQAEALRQLGDAYNRTRLTPTVRKIFDAWLRLTG